MVAIKFYTFVESRGTVLPRIHQFQDLFNVFDQQSAFFLQLGTLPSKECLCLICIRYTINSRYERISSMRWTRVAFPTDPTISWNLSVESERTQDRASGDKRVDTTWPLTTKEREHDTLSRFVFHVPVYCTDLRHERERGKPRQNKHASVARSVGGKYPTGFRTPVVGMGHACAWWRRDVEPINAQCSM